MHTMRLFSERICSLSILLTLIVSHPPQMPPYALKTDALRQTIENPALQSGLEETLRSQSSPPAEAAGIEDLVININEQGQVVEKPGINLSIYKPARGKAPYPVAMIFHGLSGSKKEEHIRKIAQQFAQRGYLAVVPNFRNNFREWRDLTTGELRNNGNESEGLLPQFALEGLLDDIASMTRYLKKDQAAEADLSRVVFAGHSYGGWAATRVAAESSDPHGDKRFADLKITTVINLSGVIHPLVSQLNVLRNDLSGRLKNQIHPERIPEEADKALALWKQTDRYETFGNQRYWLRGWEEYTAVQDLVRIPASTTYIYLVGDKDGGILGQIEASVQYSYQDHDGNHRFLPVSKPVNEFLEAVRKRGIPPLIIRGMPHAYVGRNVPPEAFPQALNFIFNNIPSAGLEEHVKQVEEFGRLVEEVGLIFTRQEKQGLLGTKISDIHADHFFTQSGVAHIPDQKGKLAVFGDRHGDFATLEKELELFILETGYNPEKNKNSQEPAYLVFVGDYQDIGKKSLETVTRLLQLKVADPEHVVFLSGNHDLARQNYDTPDFRNHPEEPWLFTRIDEILGDKQAGARIYDDWNRLAQRMANIVVTESGIVVIHASPPNTTVDQPEYGDRFDLSKGLLNISENLNIRIQLSWNFIHRGNTESKIVAEVNDRKGFDTPMPTTNWPKGFWISRTDFEQFMESIGGTVLIRGHDSEAPWDWTPYGGRCLTLMGLDYRSPDNGYPVEKQIPARFALFDLSRRYDTIDPNEILRFAWGKPAAGLEERSENNLLEQAAEAVRGDGVLVVGPGTDPTMWGGLEKMILYPQFAERIVFFNPTKEQAIRLIKMNPAVRVLEQRSLASLVTQLSAMPEADRIGVLGEKTLAGHIERALHSIGIRSMTVTPLGAEAARRMILQAVGVSKAALDQVGLEELQQETTRRRAA